LDSLTLHEFQKITDGFATNSVPKFTDFSAGSVCSWILKEINYPADRAARNADNIQVAANNLALFIRGMFNSTLIVFRDGILQFPHCALGLWLAIKYLLIHTVPITPDYVAYAYSLTHSPRHNLN
jgi:hypothetical protein